MKFKINLTNKLPVFITPVLTYFAYNGSNGASNLLSAWIAFNFCLVIIISFFFFSLLKSIHSEKLASLKKLKEFRLNDYVSISCMVFFIWAGWWWSGIAMLIGIFLLKLIGLVASQRE